MPISLILHCYVEKRFVFYSSKNIPVVVMSFHLFDCLVVFPIVAVERLWEPISPHAPGRMRPWSDVF